MDVNNLKLDGMELVAGESGLKRMVSWTYLVQTKPYEEHMNRGNFALIVVDYIRFDFKEVRKSMDELNDLGISGLAVSVVDDKEPIPKSIIKRANELCLPLFNVRWKGASFVDISQSIGNLILETNIMNKRTGDYLYNLLFGYNVNDRYVEKISGTFVFNWATIFQVIASILMMILLTSVIRFIIQHIHPKSSKGRSAVSLLNSAASYITTLICFFWCLSAIGINMTAILASVGIVALIVGFGAQSLVEDLVTGIFLVFEDQFNVGDIIETGGFRGVVESIGIRTTAIRDMGGNIKIINNSDLRNILNRSTVASFATTLVSVA